jgi:hypothetical protein
MEKKILSPLDMKLEDEETPVNTLIGKLNVLDQNDMTELTFSHHLLLEQTRLMIALSALVQKLFHAWKAQNDQFVIESSG